MKNIKIYSMLILIFILGTIIFLLNGALPIGTGYTARYLCSHVFLQNRDADEIFNREIKPTNPLFRTVSYEVDSENKIVITKAFGIFKKTLAIYREGCGCTLIINTTIEELKKQSQIIQAHSYKGDNEPYLENPSNKRDLQFDRVKLESVVNNYFSEPSEKSNRNTRAILISQNGEIIHERYSNGLNSDSLLLGWSMTKSIINALMGILVLEGKYKIEDTNLFPLWSGDDRKNIKLDNLLRMNSGLQFEEVYGPFADATYMLYDSKITSDYAMNKPLKDKIGKVWYYSSGTTNLLSRLIFESNGSTLSQNTKFLREKLLDKIKMRGAILESDSGGVFIGSSYMYASARDWARFGYLFLNDGIFNKERILPENWVQYSTTVTENTPLGEYGAQIWLNRGNPENSNNRKFPKLPSDLYYFGGYNKQIVAVIPSKKMVIVRLGVTTDGSWDHESFLLDVLGTIQEN